MLVTAMLAVHRKARSATSPGEPPPNPFAKKNRLSKKRKKSLLASHEVDKEEPVISGYNEYDPSIKL